MGETRTSRNRGRWLLPLALGATYLGWRAMSGRDASLAGQVALVTGGSRGLGFLLAQELAEQGCRVAICARDTVELDEAQARLRERGAEVLTIRCDVAEFSQVRRMVDEVTARLGPIDILVNNAGIIQVGPVESMRMHDYERAMDVMYWGALYAIEAVRPSMMERGGGRIVNITSIGGKVAVPHLLPYVGAKFALVGLSEGLRAELKRHGILVTTIVPGLMRTGSPVNALFKGNAEHEFTWFSLASSTPLTTTSARRAARRIVEATRRGEAEVTLTWQAKLLRLTHGLAPGATADLLAVVNRLLPRGDDPREYRGMELATSLSPSPATAMMNRAALENNEFAGRPRPSPRHARQVGLNRTSERLEP